ncbi:hypothetical protein Tco_1401414 [Tanacetum coccineum]
MGLLRAELEKVKQEKEGFEFKIAKFDKSAKDLEQLIGKSAKIEKPVRKNNDAPIIEDWVSDDEDEVETTVVVKKKTVIPTAAKIEKPIRKPVRFLRCKIRTVITVKASDVGSGCKEQSVDLSGGGKNATKKKKNSREECSKAERPRKIKCCEESLSAIGN